jgi:hypothetical protein
MVNVTTSILFALQLLNDSPFFNILHFKIIESTLGVFGDTKEEVWNQARGYLISKCNTRKALKNE